MCTLNKRDRTGQIPGIMVFVCCLFLAAVQPAVAQLPTAVEFDLQLNPAEDSVRVYIRHNSPSTFTGTFSGLVVTIRYDTIPGVAGPRLPNGSTGRTQFAASCYNIVGNPGAAVTSGPYKFKTYSATGLQASSECASGPLPGNNQWKLLFRVRLDDAGATSQCRTFQLAATGDPFLPFNLDTWISLNGAEIPVSIEPTVGETGPCSAGGVAVNARALLDGAYDTGLSLMRDNLRSLPAFPATQPYGGAPFSYVGTESVAPAVLAVSGSNAIVDWVLVELRSNVTPATVVATRAGLIQRDGDIVDTDGSSPLQFQAIPDGTYRVAVRHRNHLGAMTASGVALSSSPVTVDLSNPLVNTFGTEARKTVGSLRTLWAGNVSVDGQVKYLGAGDDRDPVLTAIGGVVLTTVLPNVYHQADVTMNGEVKYLGAGDDRDPILGTIGGVILNSVRVEQLP